MKTLVPFFAFFALVISPAEYRQFSSNDGVSIEARVISVEGDHVEIVLRNGRRFSVPISRFAVSDQRYLRGWNRTAATASGPAFSELNEALGISLLADGNLWDDPPASVARRLNWPNESNTAHQSSYRFYARSEFRVLGAHAYSSALYGDNGNVSRLSLVFANKGDFSAERNNEMQAMGAYVDRRPLDEAIEGDAGAITHALTNVLGEGETQSFGKGSGRRIVERWDWRNLTFLLTEEDHEYVGLLIVPRTFADAGGTPTRLSDDVLRQQSQENVVRRPNGDVVITNIPMVDQGPKGYCVPATFERCLRYLQIPADMYLLAIAGQTGSGGGTYVPNMIEALEADLRQHRRSLKTINLRPEPRSIGKYIDNGLPILWQMSSTPEFNQLAVQYTQVRSYSANSSGNLSLLTELRDQAENLDNDRRYGHLAMIIGYNEERDEIAVSDSWGPEYAERWVPAAAVEAVSRKFYIVDF